jgi:hypothetical protein
MKLHAVLIGAAALLLASAGAAGACLVAPTYDPYRDIKFYGREYIVAAPEVIVEGVVEPDASGDGSDGVGFSRMHIDQVWKGAALSEVVVIWTRAGDCSQPPPFGKRIRFGARLLNRQVLLVKDAVALTPQRMDLIESHDDFLAYNRWGAFDLPLRDAQLDPLLLAYQAETEALRRQAASGDRGARIAYAAHLFAHNEFHRSLAAYEALLRDDPADLDLLLTLAAVRAQAQPDDEPEATLAEVERKAPQTPDWRRKIAHARFTASGRLTPGWKDWSDLKPAVHCEVSEGNFDGADFTRAGLATCEFVRSSFRDASFIGADLTDAYFEDSALAGAKYDCATRLPNDLDPVAEGMINVDGSCPARAP